MLTIRRWWSQYKYQALLMGMALGVAWFFRYTQGTAYFEVYRWLAQPFTVHPTQEAQITDARILELQARLAELESQNQQFQALLGYVASQPHKGMVAPIIGRSADHWWQQMTIGRGHLDQIQIGYIVAGPGGLAGRVIHVTDHTSRVLLISDHTSRVGAVVSRSRATGFIRGQGSSRAIMEFFDKDPDVRRGDLVSTSAFSQLFPPGVAIGRVESINLSKSPAPEAVIELAVPLSSLEAVLIYPHQPLSREGSAGQDSEVH
ncbi:rod shape-determining protein MreC [Neosynechococcus sphagnicola sy1]|uniref:Cell shape-determining protein MreC n=1 Tax=Neosynechococcus sphagnicola sy1 TaxID=1497020 RepID=A0A098TL61_9CYAN|nr:rod shape-determining protein MreC [Neosynechococcus sphagnicola]KGF73031.1 rod shape-determining protein MreC [Neosynechococcus sphagnicola sy1]